MNELYGLFGGTDGSASLWSLDYANQSYSERYAIKCHSSGITDVSFQPLNEYVAVASKDKTWSFHSLFQGVKLAQFSEDQEINAIEFHPDGLMVIAGLKDGTIKIYDIRSHQEIFKMTDFKGDLGNISFSNKGLNFAAAWKSSDVCRVFNLKKLGKEVTEIKNTAPVSFVSYDNYGSYLLTGAGQSLNVYATKHLGTQATIFSQDKVVDTGVVSVAKFSASGKMIVTGGSEDRFMKVFGL
jgi:WD40 repeat protein